MSSELSWLQMCIGLFVLLGGLWYVRRTYEPSREGFGQKAPYVLKEGNQVYDRFYGTEYDTLYKTDAYANDDVLTILKYTHPSEETSSFLDIGCGTGSLARSLEKQGFTVFGVDKSQDMVDIATVQAGGSEIVCADVVQDSMLYENRSFSHILCTHFTLYEIDAKETFFRHCFHWLKSGGYLIVHVVDPERFNRIVPRSELYSYVNADVQKINKTTMDTPRYTYENDFLEQDDSSTWTQVEQFTSPGHVRRNERTWHMISKEDVFSLALQTGFIVHAEAAYADDKHQSLVVFVKPLCGDH